MVIKHISGNSIREERYALVYDRAYKELNIPGSIVRYYASE